MDYKHSISKYSNNRQWFVKTKQETFEQISFFQVQTWNELIVNEQEMPYLSAGHLAHGVFLTVSFYKKN